MKSKTEIEFKISVHESKIDELIKDTEEWHDVHSELLNNYRMGRKALLWVLSPDENILDDNIDRKVKFEIACHDSSKIF